MKMAKNERQESILRVIRAQDISTQEELVRALQSDGSAVTQATISRDIKDLGIIKVTLPNGGTKYSVLDRTGDVAPGRLLSVFSHCVLSSDVAMHLVVIKTLPGMAQAAASALDSIHLPGVIGSIAGDDTVFVATPSVDDAIAIDATIKDMNVRLSDS
ncbi:MAG TPA: arginine repressor [Bacillota bacterium]|nr:arginine repressor [Bacillota bacterium]HPE38514.1 arginine repressor [Bacillota bacterium]